MRASNNNHLSDETILGFIEGNLLTSEKDRISSHVHDCDKCFSRFSVLVASHSEMANIEAEVCPDSLIEKAKRELHLTRPAKHLELGTRRISVYVTDFLRGLNLTFQPKLIPITVVSTVLVVLTVVYIFRPQPSIRGNKQPSFDFLQRFQQKQLVSSVASKIEGLEVEVFADTVRVIQPFKFKRELSIETVDGEVFFASDFTELENDFHILVPMGQDSVIIRITTLDTVVFEGIVPIQ